MNRKSRTLILTAAERDIIADALEMWIDNQHDDIHEDDEENRDERLTHVAIAEALLSDVFSS